MSNLKAFNQTSLERKRYTIGYGNWLDTGETLFDHAVIIAPTTVPPLLASDAFTANGNTEISLFISGGVAGTIYDVKLVATTTDSQVKEDVMKMAVYTA